MSGFYKDLKAWQRAFDLAVEVYRLTKSFPDNERYGLTSQMRRSSVSLACNIAEGKGRSSDKDFIVFLCHARGSLLELETQILLARRLAYLAEKQGSTLLELTSEAGKMLNGLINSLRGAADHAA